IELGPENVACFIAEPIMGAGGVIVPPDGYHKRTKEVCENYEVLYISDEVITGFGRLGHFFASEPVFDFVPDVITCAKGISSGYLPLSATILSENIYDVISVPQNEGALFTHGFTYSGHPVSCVAGLKNIEIMERDGICEHVRKVGPYFEEQLNTLLEHPIVGDVRGSHFMLCIEIVANKETKTLLPEHLDIAKLIAQQCQSRGLFVRPIRNQVVLSPPLILTKQQIDTVVSILHESFTEIITTLSREGITIN
ncbi:MAG: aminotransferase class III-fold pyridoxal phosphate-dependent enzyme, partial [Chloroflexota bacterium]|nr:aminotransferase class III-fold pyridoxal phosphate-dependent enzyme [Chloroflexota bacterium]